MTLGSGDYRYERVEGWAKIPPYFMLGDIVGVATDSQDRSFSSAPVATLRYPVRFEAACSTYSFTRPR